MAAGAAGLLLAACGRRPAAPTPATPSPPAGYRLGARFADGYAAPTVLASGSPQRAPYVLLGADGWPVDRGGPDAIDLTVSHSGPDGEVVGTFTVARHGTSRDDGHEDHDHGDPIPYYPLVFVPPSSGDYLVDGPGISEAHALRVVNADQLDVVQVGDLLPAVGTPTILDARGVDPICTQATGVCQFHEVTVTEALGRPGPTALLVSTPRFCQQDVCGPTIGLLADALHQRTETWSAVHAEVYVAPLENDFSTTPVVAALGLSFEPSLVVADATGRITAVLHFTMDATEVAAALSSVA